MSNNETLSDIVREMRERASRRELPPEVYGLADRIEAATAEKSIAQEKPKIEQPGNAAALRKALEKIKKLNRYDLGCIRSKKRRDEFDARILEIERTVRAALAAPPRNCDVGTPEEQSVRMAEFCRAQYEKVATDVPLCSGCQFNDREGLDCQFAWAQMPYEKGGAE